MGSTLLKRAFSLPLYLPADLTLTYMLLSPLPSLVLQYSTVVHDIMLLGIYMKYSKVFARIDVGV